MLTQYPIKELCFTLFVIYLTIFFNYIRFETTLEQFIIKFPQIIYLLIFFLAILTLQFKKNYNLMSHIIFSGLIVLIFYLTTSLRISYA